MKGAGACPAPLAEPEGAARDLDRLYRRERSSLVRFFARDRATAADAEDLAQDAFLRMARVEAATPIAKPASYLRQIGRNLLRDRVKAPAHRLIVTDCDAVDAASDQTELGRLEARDSLRRLEAAMYHLKPRTREIFLAHRLDGMSYAEIAEKTGLSVKRVEKIMAKAIAQLSGLMERGA
ncbi:MAG: sigma-70 family RNA polymerase sigma factor [Sphingomonas sp.]